jgi:hypothetical protein
MHDNHAPSRSLVYPFHLRLRLRLRHNLGRLLFAGLSVCCLLLLSGCAATDYTAPAVSKTVAEPPPTGLSTRNAFDGQYVHFTSTGRMLKADGQVRTESGAFFRLVTNLSAPTETITVWLNTTKRAMAAVRDPVERSKWQARVRASAYSLTPDDAWVNWYVAADGQLALTASMDQQMILLVHADEAQTQTIAFFPSGFVACQKLNKLASAGAISDTLFLARTGLTLTRHQYTEFTPGPQWDAYGQLGYTPLQGLNWADTPANHALAAVFKDPANKTTIASAKRLFACP